MQIILRISQLGQSWGEFISNYFIFFVALYEHLQLCFVYLSMDNNKLKK